MRLRYVLNEALLGLWRNATMTIAMIITMAVSLTMLGASVLLYWQVEQAKDYYYGRIEVSIFLRDDITDAQRAALGAAIDRSPLVADKRYEDKQDAYARFKEAWRESPDLVRTVGPGALPASFRVKLKDPSRYAVFVSQLHDQRGIETVVDQRRLLERVFRIFTATQRTALVIASLMAVAAVLLVGNTIQVAAYSKRREVAVMKLVGASNWFVQAPFVVEAMAAGLVGAVAGFVLLLAGELLVPPEWTQALPPVPDDRVWMMLPLLAAVGAGVSGCTAWLTLRFQVRV
ncbi:permease-like cell division protein FtsX [Couchioplanes caeruleus]|uniref:permease-like cell division protein FtsX n=1 Tax=Couchioplanes caeruleus TaxID=56438 RepID=UPI00201C81D0|nr:permease-like cell division protein FtsX [Couchioplanes caeruleus]UQU65817.1 permease-like cell division protein FtsX [Couchioplanes caeruleus]